MKFSTYSEAELSVLADAVRSGLRGDASEDERLSASQARAKLMEAYSPLLVRLSDRYAAKLGRQEALSAAYYGCALALNSWNPDKGQISSWIKLYCKSSLIREVNKQHHIRLPQDTIAKRSKIEQMRGQYASIDDITEETKLDSEQVLAIEATPKVTVWLDAGHYEATATDLVESVHAAEHVQSLLGQLDALDKFVLSARFGVGYNGYVHSYEQLSKLLNLSIEELAVTEARALHHLRQVAQPVSE